MNKYITSFLVGLVKQFCYTACPFDWIGSREVRDYILKVFYYLHVKHTLSIVVFYYLHRSILNWWEIILNCEMAVRYFIFWTPNIAVLHILSSREYMYLKLDAIPRNLAPPFSILRHAVQSLLILLLKLHSGPNMSTPYDLDSCFTSWVPFRNPCSYYLSKSWCAWLLRF